MCRAPGGASSNVAAPLPQVVSWLLLLCGAAGSCPWNSEKVVGPEFCLQGWGQNGLPLPWSPAGHGVSINTPQTPFLPSENNCGVPSLFLRKPAWGTESWSCLRYSNYGATFTSTWGPRLPLCQQGDSICSGGHVPSIGRFTGPSRCLLGGTALP